MRGALVLLLLLLPGPGRSEDPMGPPRPIHQAPPPAPPADRVDRPFALAVLGLTALTAYDVEATFYRLDRCAGTCAEANGYLGGVVDSGRGWTYGVHTTLNAGVTYTAWKLRGSRNPRVRRLWWVPFALIGFGHVVGGTVNLTLQTPGPGGRRE